MIAFRNPSFFTIEEANWVNVIAITEDEHYVIEEQYRYGTKEICMEIPAGTVEDDEEPLLCAQRELLEETGYADGDWSLLCVTTVNPGRANNKSSTYIVNGVRRISEPNLEPSEDIAIHLLLLEEVHQLLLDEKIHGGVMTAHLWRYMFQIQYTK